MGVGKGVFYQMYRYKELEKILKEDGMTRKEARDFMGQIRREGSVNYNGWKLTYEDKQYYMVSDLGVTDEEVDYFFTAYSKYGFMDSLQDIAIDLGKPYDVILAIKTKYNITRNSLPFYKQLYTVGEAADKFDEVSKQRAFKKLQFERIKKIEASILPLVSAQTTKPIDPYPYAILDDYNDRDITVVWSMFDEHWGAEDLDSQKEFMEGLAGRSLAAIRDEKPKRVVIPFGSDLMHVDTVKEQTTKGTPIKLYDSLQNVSNTMVTFFVNCVLQAISICPVSIYIVSGNHDRSLADYSYGFLRALFSNNESVSIIHSGSARSYHACGTTLLTLQHGDISARNIDAVCLAEGSAALGLPFHRHVLVQGHFHSFRSSFNENGASLHLTCTSASPKGRWDSDRYGSISNRCTTIVSIPDDEYPCNIRFVR